MDALAVAVPVESLRDELAHLHPDAFGWALALAGGERVEAEEILQVGYLRILEGRARFAGRSSLRTWLFGVLRRVASERRRRAAARRLATALWATGEEARDPAPDPAERLEHSRATARLRAALVRLPRRQREVLHLVFYQYLTIEEAAAVLGIRFGTARTHYERGKARLRAGLGEEEP